VKFRIKTRKILGQISQGICFPLSIIAEPEYSNLYKEDDDLTDALGITQYVEPEFASLGGDAKGQLGSLGILVSDEQRIENLSKVYPRLKEFTYIVSEKLEGSSVAYVLKSAEFNVCSRSLNLNENENNTFWRVAHRHDIEEKMREYGEKHGLINWSIQGELVGEGVQSNVYKLQGHTARFYNAFNIDTQEYFEYTEFMDMIKEMGLETCPIIDDNYTLPNTIDELFAVVDNYKTTFGNDLNHLAEGWVFVAKGRVDGVKIERSNFNRLSFKAKSRNYDIDKKK
jgi:RNA ligase (TIGR02306 family)